MTIDKNEWKSLEKYPWVQYRGDIWETVFRCCCGAELVFSGTDARKRGEMHMKRFHGKCKAMTETK